VDYARRVGVCAVLAVMSRTTAYAELIRRIDWRRTGLAATLVTTVARGGGAQVTVPRAQGQAVAALIASGLDPAWRSSDGLGVATETW